MSAATRSATLPQPSAGRYPQGARSRRAPDKLCAEAVELAREAAREAADPDPGTVGEWIEAVSDEDRVVTHFFEARMPGYRGWRWAVTVARASRAKKVTVDESVLLPGQDALLGPEWVPWSERLRPGDLGPGDLLPTEAEDPRLEPGFLGEDVPPPNSPVADEQPSAPGAERVGIGAVADEPGMGRKRVLSRIGLHEAADRWEESYGPKTPMAQSAPASCVSCGFLVPVAGSLRQAFGICANEFSPADGHVVSLAYGCGGHSEAAVMPRPPQPPPHVIDETLADPFTLSDAAPQPDATPGEGTPDADPAGAGAAAKSTAGNEAAANGATSNGTSASAPASNGTSANGAVDNGSAGSGKSPRRRRTRR